MDMRKMIVSAAYIVSGLRMGLGGIMLAVKGHLGQELPRYQYQRQRWARRGVTEDNKLMFQFTMQCEIFVQCVANMGLLSVPLMLQSAGYLTGSLTLVEMVGWGLWCASLAWEHTADMQKLSFAKECKKSGRKGGVCNIGLWQYCRHPNYFGEWMVWNSLVLASLPSAMAMFNIETFMLVKIGLTLGLVQVSQAMYNCLVYYTGAIPSEHYSLIKRPDYAQYQKQVNMFFPSPWTSNKID